VFSATLAWQSQNLLIASTRSWARAVLTWNLALDPSGGPHVGGCTACTGVVTIHPDGTVTRNAEYYMLAHASRFVPPGSTALATTAAPDTAPANVAFRTPDGSLVVVAYNDSADRRTVRIVSADGPVTVTVPGRSLATMVTSHAGDAPAATPAPARLDLVRTADLSPSAAPRAPQDPCCVTDTADRATDADRSTRWTSGRAQRSDDWFQVDTGAIRSLGSIVLDAGPGADWPRTLDVLTSTDGRHWAVLSTDVRGFGAVLAVDLQDTRARFVRLRLASSDTHWWSVAEASVYARSRR